MSFFEQVAGEVIDECGAGFVILVGMEITGPADFAQHDGFEMAGAGGEALEIKQAGIAQIACGDFSGLFHTFFFVFVFFGLVIHGQQVNLGL